MLSSLFTNRRSLFVSLLLVVFLFGKLATLSAQSFYGSVVGSVSDPTGATIPGADILLTNLGTNDQQRAKSDNSGNYRVLNLVPGRYRLEVTKGGFERLVRKEVLVEVQSAVRIDAALKVGQSSETVEVTSQTPLLDTENATVSQVVSGRTVQDIPLNGRNVTNLIELAPGVVPQASALGATTANSNGGTSVATNDWGNYQIGGGMANQNALLLDGATINIGYGANVGLVPTQDSVAEFRISANNVPADSGRSSGGVINTTTKSGTNAFHGNIYEFLRNTDFNANSFFSARAGTPRPEFIQSQYGGTLGGPIVKNKLFAFLSSEDQQFHLQGSSLFSVPTLAELKGDFSGPGIPTIYDPLTICGFYGNPACAADASGAPIYTRQAFAGNQIPAGRIDPTSNVYKTFWAPPNTNGTSLTNNYAVNQSIKGNQNQQNVRLDYTLSDKQRLFAHYTYWRGNQSAGLPFSVPITGGRVTFFAHDLVLGDTYVFSPTMIGDLRGAFLRFDQTNRSSSLGEPLSQFGPGWSSLVSQVNQQGYPGAVVSGLFGFANSQGNSFEGNNVFSLNGSITKIFGRHSLKFGGEARRLEWYYLSSSAATGVYNFDNGFTAQNPLAPSGTGLGFASFLLGFPSSGSATEVKAVSQYENYIALFLQDAFKVNNKLQLFYGLRWDVSPGEWAEKHGNSSVFMPTALDPLGTTVGLALQGQVVPVGSPAYGDIAIHPSHRDLFAPRLGVTYLLTPSTVVRAGYSVMFTPTNASAIDAPWESSADSATTNMIATLNGGITPAATYKTASGGTAGTFNNPFPTGLLQVPGRDATAISSSVEGTSITDPIANQAFPYMQQWNLGVENQSFHGILVGAAYIGAKGTHLPMNGNFQLNQLQDKYDSMGAALLNQVPNPFYQKLRASAGTLETSPTIAAGQLLRPYPQFLNVISTGEYIGGSSYNSLQVKGERRFGSAGVLAGNYTWAKLLSNTDSLNTGNESPGTIQDFYNVAGARSLASFDVSNRVVIDYVLSLPVGRGKKFLGNINAWEDRLIGGWAINGVTTYQKGFPLVFTAQPTALSTSFGAGTPKPNIIPGCKIALSGSAESRLNQYFNTACFTAPSTFGFGNAGRTTGVRAEGINNYDFALSKATVIHENVRFELRFEGFNVLNHPQFNAPGAQFGSSNFGVTSSTAGSQANQPRILQIAARVTY